MRLGLVVALPEEARALVRVMRGVQRERPDPKADRIPGRGSVSSSLHLITGTLAGQPIMVAWAGAGAECAARAASALLQQGVDSLLAIGFAGGLSPALRPGDLLAAAEIIEPDGRRWPADAAWLIAFEDLSRCNSHCLMGDLSAIIPMPNRSPSTLHPLLYLGKLVTAPRVVAAAAEKRRLGEQTGALAVDMESAAVARCAAAAGVPMVALRAMTDSVDESLPLDFELCFDPDGQFHSARLMGLLARRPLALGGLMRLSRHSARAGQSLASFLALHLPCLARS